MEEMTDTMKIKLGVILALLILGFQLCLSGAFGISISEVKDDVVITIQNSGKEFIYYDSFNKETYELTLILDIDAKQFIAGSIPFKLYSNKYENKQEIGTLNDIQKEDFPKIVTINLNEFESLYGLNRKTGYEIHLGETSASIIIDNPAGDFIITTDFFDAIWDDDKGTMSSYAESAGSNMITDRPSPNMDGEHGTTFGFNPRTTFGTISSRVNSGNVVSEIVGEIPATNWTEYAYVYKESPCMRFQYYWNGTSKLSRNYGYFGSGDEITHIYFGDGTEDGGGAYPYDDSSTENTGTVGITYMQTYAGSGTWPLFMWTNKPYTAKSNYSTAWDHSTVHWFYWIDDNLDKLIEDINLHYCIPTSDVLTSVNNLYWEVQEKHGASVSMTTGTYKIESGIHFEFTPVSNDLSFNYKGNTSEQNSGYQYLKFGGGIGENYTTQTIKMYNSTTTVADTDTAWEITFDYVNDWWNYTDVTKIDCAIGQRVGNYRQDAIKDNNGCNETLDIVGNPMDGAYLWFESYNTNETAYFIVDGDGNHTFPAPVVDSAALNNTTPNFLESVNCTAVVSHTIDIGDLTAVWANLTYGNGTVLPSQQMSNWTNFDYNTTFNGLDFVGSISCDVTAYDKNDEAAVNNATGTIPTFLEISNITTESPVFELTNETYSIQFTERSYLLGFNVSLFYDYKEEGIDFNNSNTFTKYRNTGLLVTNNTSRNVEFNTTVTFANGTTFTNRTIATQSVWFGYSLTSGNATSNNMLEGRNFTYTMNDALDIDYGTNLTRYLFFNGTNHTITRVIGGLDYLNLSMDRVNDTNKYYEEDYFGWTQIDNGTYLRNTTSASTDVSVHKTLFTACYPDTNATVKFMDFFIYNERNRTQAINSSIDVLWYIHDDLGGISRSQNFIKYDISEGSICGYPSWAVFDSVNMSIEYWSNNATANGLGDQKFPKREYYFVMTRFANLTTLSKTVNMYLINSDLSQQYEMTVVDNNRNAIEGAIIHVLRKYAEESGGGGTFFATMAKTNSHGNAYAYLEKPTPATLANITKYKFLIYLDNVLVHEDSEFHTLTSNTEIPDFQIDIEEFISGSAKIGDLYSNCTLSLVGDSGTVGCGVTDRTLALASGKRTVVRKDILNGNEILCSQTITGEANFEFADCVLGNVTDNVYSWAIDLTYNDGSVIATGGIFDHTSPFNWGDTGLFMGIMLTITLVFFGLWNPVLAIIMLIFSIIINGLFGFIPWGVGTITWIVISLGIILYTVMRG